MDSWNSLRGLPCRYSDTATYQGLCGKHRTRPHDTLNLASFTPTKQDQHPWDFQARSSKLLWWTSSKALLKPQPCFYLVTTFCAFLVAVIKYRQNQSILRKEGFILGGHLRGIPWWWESYGSRNLRLLIICQPQSGSREQGMLIFLFSLEVKVDLPVLL